MMRENELTRLESLALQWQMALRRIMNVLGPDEICNCEEQHCDGLRAEAHEALRIAKEALNVND